MKSSKEKLGGSISFILPSLHPSFLSCELCALAGNFAVFVSSLSP